MAEKKRILVVDDEPQITRVLRTSLAGSGYEVRTADDGHAGLRVAREWQPDLVITDISMPNMNGIELCRAASRGVELADHRVVGKRGGEDQG